MAKVSAEQDWHFLTPNVFSCGGSDSSYSPLSQRNPVVNFGLCGWEISLRVGQKQFHTDSKDEEDVEWTKKLHALFQKSLNLIKRNFWFCERDTKRTLYKSLVRPKMEYASVVWDYLKCKITKFVGRFPVSRTTLLELISLRPRLQDIT